MKHTFKKALSFVLTLALLMGMVAVPVSAVDQVTVTTSMENVLQRAEDNQQVYKLVFKLKSPNGFNTMSTVLSYDNAVILPVNYQGNTFADFVPANKGLVYEPLNTIVKGANYQFYNTATAESYIKGGRTAFIYDISSTAPLLSMSSIIPVFEFYFRLADGKTFDDINAGTFRIETDKSEGSFLDEIYSTDALPTHYGLMVFEPDDTKNYYPTTISLTLNYENCDVTIPLGAPSVALSPIVGGGLTATVTDSVNTGESLAAIDKYVVTIGSNNYDVDASTRTMTIPASDLAGGVSYTATVYAAAVMSSGYGDSPVSDESAPVIAPYLTLTATADTTITGLKVGTAVSGSITDYITVTGGSGTYRYSAEGLPAGVTLNEDGTITGSPTTTSIEGAASVTVTSTDEQTVIVSVRYSHVGLGDAVVTPAQSVIEKTYGDAAFALGAPTYSVEELAPTYSYVVTSGSAVSVDADAGEVTLLSVGTSEITITANADNYAPAQAVVRVNVAPKTITDTDFIFDLTNKIYNGTAWEPAVTPVGLVPLKDYQVQHSNNENAGIATITVTGIGNYTGEITKTFIIEHADATVTVDATVQLYINGESKTITPVYSVAGLTPTYTYQSADINVVTVDGNGVMSPVAIGTTTVTVTAIDPDGNYKMATDTITVTVSNKTDVSEYLTFSTPAAIPYDGVEYVIGNRFVPAGFGGVADGVGIIKYYYENTTYDSLAEITAKAKDAGSYVVTAIYEDSTQYGVKSAVFVIEKAAVTVTPNELVKTYGQPDPALAYMVAGKPAAGVDINGSLERVSGEDSGTYAVNAGSITDENNLNYTITFTTGKQFTINGKPLSAADLKYEGDPITKVYDGSSNAVLPVDGKIVVKQASLVGADVSPTLSFSSAVYDNKDVVSATKVTFTMDALAGNYTLTSGVTLEQAATIIAKDIEDAVVTLADASKPYNGTAQTTTITSVVLGTTPLVLTSDYMVSEYPSLTNVGQVDFEVKGLGNYTGFVNATFEVTKADTTINITNAANDLDKAYNGVPVAVPSISTSVDGDVTFEHYTDAAAINKLDSAPVDAGTYYVKAFLVGTENYNASDSTVFAYTISPVTLGAVSLQLPDDFVVTKVYDGTTAPGTMSGNKLIVPTGVNGEQLDINIVSAGTYPSKDVDTNLTVTLNIGDTLADKTGKASNYTIVAGFPTTHSFTQASIIPADYTLTVPGTQSVKIGSNLTALPAAVTSGVNSETPAGTQAWYTDLDRTIALDNETLSQLPLGTHNLYWKFRSTVGNYITVPKIGTTVVTIVEGDPQNITITNIPAATPTYGDLGFTLGTVVKTIGEVVITDGGAISWESSDPSVATVVADTGAITIVGRGTATIKATAAAVPGKYAEGTVTFDLTVNPKPLNVTTGTYKVSKVYDGTTSPGTAIGNLVVAGIVGSDNISVIATPSVYSDKNVGGHATIDVSLTLSGDAMNNYILGSSTLAVPCEILQKEITAVTIENVNKTYDGTTGAGNAIASGIVLEGKVDTDVLDIALTFDSFSDGNVATPGKTATVTLGTLSDAINYKLAPGLSPLAAPATIVPATIDSIADTAPADTILANDVNNTDLASLKAKAISLPSKVTVNYSGSKTELLDIVWTDAAQAFDVKGRTYTYQGSVITGSNFNAYPNTLDATLNVMPVQLTSIANIPASLTLAKSTVENAAALTDVGFPAQVTLNFDNSLGSESVNATWNKTIDDLKTVAATVSDGQDRTLTIGLTDTNIPDWATVDIELPSVNVLVTNKFVVDSADITFPDISVVYGDEISPNVATSIISGYTTTYIYNGTGSTTYGPSETAPVNAGTYSVIAVVENDTHKGTKTATLTINPKALVTITISDIADQIYTATPLIPDYSVQGDSVDLVADTDYTGVFTANTDVGIATLTVTCKGNYTGSVTKKFNIIKATPIITFSNTSQSLTSVGNNITDVTTTLTPASAGATVTVHYWVVVTPAAPCTVVHDLGCASIASGNIADCDCTANHTVHDVTCGYVAADIYGWVTTLPQTAGTYKIYASTAGDVNLNPVNAVAPDESTVTDTLVIRPYSSSGGGTVTPPTVVNPPVTTDTTTTVTTTITPITTGLTSTATITARSMNTAVNSALTAAETNGTVVNVEVKVDAPKGAKEVQVIIPKTSVNTLVDQGTAPSLTVTSNVAQVTLDENALEAINEEAKGQDITIVVRDVDKKSLSDEEQALVGDRPVLDLVVMSAGVVISDFRGGNATVKIPYTLKEGETQQGLTIWFMTDEGQLTEIPCTYDASTGMVTFITQHFSKYVLGYFPFVDLADGDWYYENAIYAYTNGLIAGVSSDRFDPLGKTTRAMVVTILWRLEGKPVAALNKFGDVSADTWYSDAISWAAANGIVSGYSSSKFGPADTITREQMAVIIYNYGVHKGYDMKVRKDFSTFEDNSKVSAWAQNSMQWAVENGIISGVGSNKLDPAGSAQRAQVAAILQRFIENIAK